MKRAITVMLALSCACVIGACDGKSSESSSKKRSRHETQKTTQPNNPSSLMSIPKNVTRPEVEVSGDLVLSRGDYNALLAQEMLFGSNLQIGELKDPDTGLSTSQVLSGNAHYIGRFVRSANKFQLVADTSFLNESDYPAQQIVLEFDVTSENADSVGLRLVNVGAGAALQWGLKNVSVRWVRSIAFDTADKTLVLETSLRDDVAGGTLHFLESAFPRGRFGNRANAIVLDAPDFPATGEDEQYAQLLSRIGVFTTESWTSVPASSSADWSDRVVKKELSTATRYDISEGRTIDWWATANTPDELLSDIAAGVEGWNRYFKDFRPSGKVMRFRGKLPEDVKLGDFRYNVVRFDAVADAGAAYESQNYDPVTGIQTNSMIYLPFAWYNIGRSDYVEGINDTRKPSSRFLQEHTKCLRDLNFQTDTHAIMMETARSAGDAGRALMRSTLLHEVGHALGMMHNFRGSNSGEIGNHGNEGWLYSNSVMDYNTPALEDFNLFLAVNADGTTSDATKGPQLSYDKQFIDIIYNGGKQMLAAPDAFPPLPNCNDDDADNLVMGADPTCIRYDFFANALEGLRFATARMNSASDSLDPALGHLPSLRGILAQVKDQAIRAIAAAAPEDVPSVLVMGLSEVLATSKQFSYSSYLSYRSAVNKYAPLLGEWKPLPEEMTRDSEEAALAGWQTLPIFDADGKATEALYIQYQKDVRSGILAILTDGLGALRGEATSEMGRRIDEVVAVADSLAMAAIARSDIDDETRATAQQLGEILAAKINNLRKDVALRMLKDLASLNWDGVVENADGATSKGRANLSSPIAQQLFSELRKVVGISGDKVDPALRLKATGLMVKVVKRAATWDSATQKKAWKNEVRTLTTSLRTEFRELDNTLTTTGYLSEAQRVRHEALAKMIVLLTESLKPSI